MDGMTGFWVEMCIRDRFKTPEGVVGHIAGITGLAASCDPATPEELLQVFDLAALPTTFPDLVQVRWE